MNQIDGSCALILEDALEQHTKLKNLLISQNPLGTEGMRCFLRLLSRSSSGLVEFDCNSCYGHPGEGLSESAFNLTDPVGRYKLDLGCVFGRTVLRMLYKVCEKLQLNPERAFCDMQYTVAVPRTAVTSKKGNTSVPVSSYKHPVGKDESGLWRVPTTGVLTAVFSIEEALSKLWVFEDDQGRPTKECLAHAENNSFLRSTCQNSKVPAHIAACYIDAHLDLVRIQ